LRGRRAVERADHIVISVATADDQDGARRFVSDALADAAQRPDAADAAAAEDEQRGAWAAGELGMAAVITLARAERSLVAINGCAPPPPEGDGRPGPARATVQGAVIVLPRGTSAAPAMPSAARRPKPASQARARAPVSTQRHPHG